MKKFRDRSIIVKTPLVIGLLSFLIVTGICLLLMFPLRMNDMKNSAKIAQLTAVEAGCQLIEKINTSASMVRAYSGVVEHLIESDMMPKEKKREWLLEDMKMFVDKESKVKNLWCTLEPNALDGMDDKFINREDAGSNRFGIFAPWYISGKLTISEGDELHHYYTIPKETKREVITEPYWDKVIDEKIHMFSFVVPIMYNGQFQGVIGTDFYAEDLSQMIAELSHNTVGKLITDKGTIAVYHDYSKIGQPDQDNREVLERLAEGKLFDGMFKVDGRKVYKVYVPIQLGEGTKPWFYAVEMSAKEIYAQANRTVGYLFAFGLLGVILLTFAGWWMTRPTLKDILTVTDIIHELSLGRIGNLNIDDSQKQDELGKMKNELSLLLTGLKRTADFAKTIGKGNLDAEYLLLSEYDMVGKSMLEMRQRLQVEIEEMQAKQEEMQQHGANLEKVISDNEYQLVKLSLVIKSVEVGLWDMYVDQGDFLNPNYAITYSDEFRHLLGYTNEDDFPNVIGSWSEKLHPDDKDAAFHALAKHLYDRTGKTPFDIEYRLLKKNGEYAYFHAFGATVRDENGNALRVAGGLKDITEDKKAVEDMRRKQNELSEALEDNKYQLVKLALLVKASGIVLWDMEVVKGDPVNPANTFTWSDEFRKMLGYENEYDFPNVLRSWSNKLHPEEKEKTLEAFRQHLLDKSGKIPYNTEFRLQKKNGEYGYYHAYGATIRDAEGNALRVAGAIKDISEEKRKAEEMRRNEIELEEFLAIVQKSELMFREKSFWYEALLDAFKNNPITATDLNKNITFVNQATLNLLKKNREEVIGKRCGTIWGLDICNDERCCIECMIRDMNDTIFTFGDEILTSSVSYIEDTAGEKIGHVSVISNITKETRKTVYSSKEFLRLAECISKLSNGDVHFDLTVEPPNEYAQEEYENFCVIASNLEKIRQEIGWLMDVMNQQGS